MERNQQKSLLESLVYVIDDNWLAQSVSAILDDHFGKRGRQNQVSAYTLIKYVDNWKNLFDVASVAGIAFQSSYFKLATYQQKLARTLVKSIEKASSDYYEVIFSDIL